MSLALDDRQRAMLAEFGIRFLEPAVAAPAPAPAARLQAATAAPAFAPEKIARNDLPTRGLPVFDAQTPAVAGPAGIEAMDWDALAGTVTACQACGLCNTRRSTVFGVGDRQADWLIIGDSPDENDELQGEPFVGQAGQLLDNMLRAMGLDRSRKVYIANLLKCRPPSNRMPEPAELAQCAPFLQRQVELLQPKMILVMGRFAAQSLLQTTEPIGKLRGRAHQYHGVPLVVTYPPAYLLRNQPDKARAWADLCLAQDILEGKAPAPAA